MNLSDIFLGELEKLPDDTEHKAVRFLGKELAKRYSDQQETLAGIATLYVKTFNEMGTRREAGEAGHQAGLIGRQRAGGIGAATDSCRGNVRPFSPVASGTE